MNDHIGKLITFDVRHEMFAKATRFVDYELVEGDIVEFGVYTGRSLMLLSHFHEEFKKTIHGYKTPSRTVIGIDSFQGLLKNDHERWQEGTFKLNQSWHPVIPKGELVTPQKVISSFEISELTTPVIIDGFYNQVKERFDQSCKKVALIHIDCDLYDSTMDALNLVKDKIQDGAIILFDDWFNFKGSPEKGEQGAFADFLKENPEIVAIPYQPYATFCYSFILKIT